MKKRRSPARLMLVCVRDLAATAALAHLVLTFFIQPVRVEGTSMQPSLMDQERVFVSKVSYQLFPVKRGDVVVFQSPENPDKALIKRVIGVPGDRVRIEDGAVYVNGRKAEEPYLRPESRDFSNFGPVQVPDKSYFVLGDHRSVSSDSRYWGFVKEGCVLGRAVLKYWPVGDFGFIR